MATYFVASGGSNTSPYDTWAKAATSLQTALTAASSDGDVVVIQYDAVPSGDAEVAADTTYTMPAASISVIAASNDGGSAFTPTPMGTANWIGNSTTNRFVEIAVGSERRYYFYGITIRIAGSMVDRISVATANSGAQVTFEDCRFLLDNTATTARINIGDIAGRRSYVSFKNCWVRFGNAAQSLSCAVTRFDWIGGGIDASGSAPNPFIETDVAIASGTALLHWIGVDISHVGSGTLVANLSSIHAVHLTLDRCKISTTMTRLHASWIGVKLVEVTELDCHSGDTHGLFGYYNPLGSVVSDSTIYYTSGSAAQSWKIVTTSLCGPSAPFETPWVSFYNTGTSAITPRFEILRDGSTTAYTDAQVWAEFLAKVTSASTQTSFSTDRASRGSAGSNQANGAGLGSWTGESGTAWSGKCDSGSSITPAEAGDISGRVVVGAASLTVYVDPEIRTA